MALAEAKLLDLRERDITTAWMVAAFSRQEKLQPLQTLLANARRPAALTPAAQRTQVALLAEHLGAPIVPISKEAAHALARLGLQKHGR